MRRQLAYFLVWAVATSATVGMSWLGLRSVLFAGAPDRPAPLSAAELRRAAPSGVSATPLAQATRAPTTKPSRPPNTAPAVEWTPVPDGRGGTAYKRTFRLRGGETTIWFGRDDVRPLATRPRPGFSGSVIRWAPGSILISFSSGQHTSRVWATWRRGPYAEVTEATERESVQ